MSATLVKAIMGGLQVINALTRRDHVLSSILSSGVRGELTPAQVEKALLERMRQNVGSAVDDWNAGKRDV